MQKKGMTGREDKEVMVDAQMTDKGDMGSAKRGVTGAMKVQRGRDKRGEGGVLKRIEQGNEKEE